MAGKKAEELNQKRGKEREKHACMHHRQARKKKREQSKTKPQTFHLLLSPRGWKMTRKGEESEKKWEVAVAPHRQATTNGWQQNQCMKRK